MPPNLHEVPVQIRDFAKFLNANEQLLEKLLRLIPGCHCTVDFSWDFPKTSAGQYNCFPGALLTRLGVLGIDLDTAIWWVARRAANGKLCPGGNPAALTS